MPPSHLLHALRAFDVAMTRKEYAHPRNLIEVGPASRVQREAFRLQRKPSVAKATLDAPEAVDNTTVHDDSRHGVFSPQMTLDYAVHDDSANKGSLLQVDVAEPAGQLAEALKVECAFSVPVS